jgi:hypothetical protein
VGGFEGGLGGFAEEGAEGGGVLGGGAGRGVEAEEHFVGALALLPEGHHRPGAVVEDGGAGAGSGAAVVEGEEEAPEAVLLVYPL